MRIFTNLFFLTRLEELSRLKDTKQRLTKRIDEVQKEADNEVEKLKEDLRAAKREVREKAKKFELEKENLEKYSLSPIIK